MGKRHECGAAKDTVQHTVEICSAHEEERDKLRNEIGEDLSSADFIQATTDDDRKRTAVITFCVMTAKEAKSGRNVSKRRQTR